MTDMVPMYVVVDEVRKGDPSCLTGGEVFWERDKADTVALATGRVVTHVNVHRETREDMLRGVA